MLTFSSNRAITEGNLSNIQSGKKEEEEKNIEPHHMKLKSKLDSHNWEFDEAMKNIIKESKEVTIKKILIKFKLLKRIQIMLDFVNLFMMLKLLNLFIFILDRENIIINL